MALYKLTKGSLSKIRNTENGVRDLMACGFVFDGEVDTKFNVINPNPVFVEEKNSGEDEELEILKKQAIDMGIPASSVNRFKTAEKLKEKIDSFGAEEE